MMEHTNSSDERYRLGIDIGGTFTDFSAVNSKSGRQVEFKTPTVPDNPERGVENGIKLLAERGIRPEQIEYFIHGTTIALNTIIQRSGSQIALLVTEGFRDVLEQGRIRLPIPWDFYSRRPEPLIPRKLVIPVRERIRHDGIEVPLTKEEIDRVVTQLNELKIEGVAICLLHSYANPSHERLLKEAIKREAPRLFVSASSEIWPQMREYERTVVTVMNAYVRPAFSRYLDNLENTLNNLGVNARPYLTKSNGGIMTTNAAKETPVETLLSGPASGVVGAFGVGKGAKIDNLITFDMGGTSADVAVIQEGKANYSREEQIGDFPMILPAIGISSIGAGGGSIAWLDSVGVLKVGPNSAGAIPGPACYGLGGKHPTLSDAFLLCGYLNPTSFAGDMELNVSFAEKAMRTISEPLDLSIQKAADAVIQVALANMYAELSGVLERKGIDPRDYTLVSFGGAGSVVACQLAEEVNINRVIVPESPGTLSALGSLKADVMSDFIRTVNWQLDLPPSESFFPSFDYLKKSASQWLEQETPSVARKELRWSAEMRYVGQSYEIDVPLEEAWIQGKDKDKIANAFHDEYSRLFNYSDTKATAEIVNLRLRAIGLMPQPPEANPVFSEQLSPLSVGSRSIIFSGTNQKARVFRRDYMAVGDKINGPVVIEQTGSTTIVPLNWTSEVDRQGNLIISRKVRS
ncbi:hydantoinase/oxoprolinase family protein [Lentibacillus sp. N15]|uniref:hydantoinase/oxoprolinase family protein n=1 Tax=Lentibacillus songyuanensis TaxID=3136161 RepID=UPI0031BB47B8